MSATLRQGPRDSAGRHLRGSTRLNSSFSRPFVNCLCQLLLAEAPLFINHNQWPVGMKNSPSQPAEEKRFRLGTPLASQAATNVLLHSGWAVETHTHTHTLPAANYSQAVISQLMVLMPEKIQIRSLNCRSQNCPISSRNKDNIC